MFKVPDGMQVLRDRCWDSNGCNYPRRPVQRADSGHFQLSIHEFLILEVGPMKMRRQGGQRSHKIALNSDKNKV